MQNHLSKDVRVYRLKRQKFSLMYYTLMIFLLVFNLGVLEHLFHLYDID